MEHDTDRGQHIKQAAFTGCAIAALILGFVVTMPLWIRPEPSRPTNCLSNEKQIGLALIQYCQDNDEDFPYTDTGAPSRSWRAELYPYIKSREVYQCPDRRDKSDGPDGYAASYAANDSGVFGNDADPRGLGVFAPPGAKPLALADFDDPRHIIAVCEVTGTAAYDFDADDPIRFGPGKGRLWGWHSGRSSFLLLDGHARQISPPETPSYRDQVQTGDKGSNSGPINLWYRDGKKPLSAAGIANIANYGH